MEPQTNQNKSTKSFNFFGCICATAFIVLYVINVSFCIVLNQTKAELRQTKVELEEFKSNVTNEFSKVRGSIELYH